MSERNWRESERKTTSPCSSVDPANGISRVLEHVYLSFMGLPIYRWVFPTLEIRLLLSMQISYHSQFIPLDLSGNVLKGFGRSLMSWSPSAGLAFGQQSLFSTSLLHVHCTMMYLAPGARMRISAPENCCPTPVRPPSPDTSCYFSQHVISKDIWLAAQLSDCLRH